MKGRKPLPAALRLVKGIPAKSATPPALAADLPPAAPPPPDFLGETAANEWRRVVERLADCGLMTDLDVAVLAGYCDCFGTFADATRELRELGTKTKTTTKNNIVQHPLVGVIRVARADMLRFAVEFGMTPSARSRIDIGIGNPVAPSSDGASTADPSGAYF